MAKHETYTAIMNTGIAWGAIVAVLVYFTTEKDRIFVGGLFTLAFWLVATTYFSLDYRKIHKRHSPKVSLSPLTEETPIKPIDKKPSIAHERWIFIKNRLFVILEVVECIFCLGFMTNWVTVVVPYAGYEVPVLTYQNGFLIGLFIIGVFLFVDIALRFRNPKKAFLSK